MKTITHIGAMAISVIALFSCANGSSNNTNEATVTTDSVYTAVGEAVSHELTEEETGTTQMDPSQQRLVEKKHLVKGTPNIKSFIYALLPAANDYYDNPGNLLTEEDIIDLKNGFFESVQEGDGMAKTQCCYWNRTDGKKLVAYYSDEHEWEDTTVARKSYLLFFLYNEETKELENIEAPFGQPISGEGHLICELPKKGKNIQFYFGEENADPAYSTLQWNGMGFDLK